jgi:methionine synthase II (cobalamin-independent)
MLDRNKVPQRVHLVGSIGIDTVEEVFSTVGRMLGRRIRRVPDGEPGGRRLWAGWQYPLLRANPYLRADPSGAVRKNSRLPQLCLAEGVTGSEVRFSELGYSREARASYLDFRAARERGELPADVRFQVCVPTPIAVVYSFCTTRDLIAILDAYEKAMIREVEAICRGIPHRDLCIQFDLCQEMILCDGQPQDEFPAVESSLKQIIERVRRLCDVVPGDVELGFHLCYGDYGAKHFIEPRDMTRLVEVANALSAAISHDIAYIHMPVPVSRTDDDYFRPLAGLNLRGATEIYLGLVHASDGPDGTRRRIETAQRYLQEFGVASECGMARARTADVVEQLLKVHAEVTREPA